jgi:hypothetical protein
MNQNLIHCYRQSVQFHGLPCVVMQGLPVGQIQELLVMLLYLSKFDSQDKKVYFV